MQNTKTIDNNTMMVYQIWLPNHTKIETLDEFILRKHPELKDVDEATKKAKAIESNKAFLDNTWNGDKTQYDSDVDIKFECDKWLKLQKASKFIGNSNIYQSSHKNAESAIQNGVMTQIAELNALIEDIRDGAIASMSGESEQPAADKVDFKIDGVDIGRNVPIYHMTAQDRIDINAAKDKIKALIAYKKEMLNVELQKQRTLKQDLMNGVPMKDALNKIHTLHIASQSALDGKLLHINWIKATVGDANFNQYLIDTHETNYVTHLEDDQPVK